MKKRFAAATLSGLSVAVLSGCAPWVNDAIYLAEDVKNASDEYEQEQHEERVEEFNQEYEEYLRSKDEPGTNDEEAEQSIVIIKDDVDGD